MWVAYAVMALGYGLMIRLDDTSNMYVFHHIRLVSIANIFRSSCACYICRAERALFPLVAALGTGCLFQIPLIGLQAAMPLKDMATSTSAFVFLRQLGGTIGISIGQAIWSSVCAAISFDYRRD